MLPFLAMASQGGGGGGGGGLGLDNSSSAKSDASVSNVNFGGIKKGVEFDYKTVAIIGGVLLVGIILFKRL